MQKIEKIEQKIIKNKLSAMTCDICGKDILTDFVESQECFNIVHSCGYGSLFGDGSIITIDICQKCFKEKLGQYIGYISKDDLLY